MKYIESNTTPELVPVRLRSRWSEPEATLSGAEIFRKIHIDEFCGHHTWPFMTTTMCLWVHRAIKTLSRLPGWEAMGLESYLDWLRTLENISVERDEKGIMLHNAGPLPARGIVLRLPTATGFQRKIMPPFTGRHVLELS
ncbi:hypothetical protein LJC15_00350 [Desulfovibrio sp. OttesenSCG-928-G11]|nr:hypothetical protein [Desulfovibrio sp. OttesenSCG-928-G11]